MKKRSGSNQTVEVIGFTKGIQQATVVTDGAHTRSFTAQACRAHQDVKSAIAYLVSLGYHIMPDMAW